jgi:hypothetical protein
MEDEIYASIHSDEVWLDDSPDDHRDRGATLARLGHSYTIVYARSGEIPLLEVSSL